MGIGISVESAVLPKAWLFRSKDHAALVHIVQQTHAWAEARGFGPLFTQIILDEMTLEMRLLPVTEPIFVSDVGCRLSVAANVSDMGPGCHAAVVARHAGMVGTLYVGWNA